MTRLKASGMYCLIDDKWVEMVMPACPDCGEPLNVYAFDNSDYIKCECDNCKTSDTIHYREIKNEVRILLERENNE